jgi:thiosulfate reductase cytochrome b subunit
MPVSSAERRSDGASSRHTVWVRLCHWILTASVLTLAFSGYVILMVHPRLYWGEVGNDLTPALIELPISRNHQHGGWTTPKPFAAGAGAAAPVSASRTFEIFNQNGWGRSLHFLAAWCLVVPGLVYLLRGLAGGHFRAHLWPAAGELAPRAVGRHVVDHLRWRIPPATGGPRYNVLQKIAYTSVVFAGAPLMVLTGLAMSPAIGAALPWLPGLFGGFQSARTIHFFAFVGLVLFLLGHVVMVVASGFRTQMRAMTFPERVNR